MSRFLSLVPMNVALFAVPSLAWAQKPSDYYGPHMMWGGWFFGPVMMIVFIAVAAIVVVLIVRWLGGSTHSNSQHSPAPPGKTPVDILKERFARGEIDKDEFEERRRILDD